MRKFRKQAQKGSMQWWRLVKGLAIATTATTAAAATTLEENISQLFPNLTKFFFLLV